MNCPYCQSPATLVDSAIVYGRSYGMIYLCSKYPECDSYVGVHKGTSTPLGRMANAELRKWKKKAHSVFDPLWKAHGLSRHQAYQHMARAMELSVDDAHIGMFDVDQCKKMVELIGGQA